MQEVSNYQVARCCNPEYRNILVHVSLFIVGLHMKFILIFSPGTLGVGPGQRSRYSEPLLAGRLAVRTPDGAGDFLSPHSSCSILEPTRPRVQQVTRLYPGNKATGEWRWPPIRRDRNEWDYNSAVYVPLCLVTGRSLPLYAVQLFQFHLCSSILPITCLVSLSTTCITCNVTPKNCDSGLSYLMPLVVTSPISGIKFLFSSYHM